MININKNVFNFLNKIKLNKDFYKKIKNQIILSFLVLINFYNKYI